MCAQCMIGATAAAAGASGMRAWLAAHSYAWVTPRRLRYLTIGLVALGLVGASAGVNVT
jgi:hypothetical protein